MKISVFKDQEALSEAVADYIIDLVQTNPKATMVLTSGSTPILAYQKIAHKSNKKDFENVTIIGLDEWVGISAESEGSCRFIVEENLLKPLQIPATNFTFFNSLSEDLSSECVRIDKLIFENGGLDFIIVGLGPNGHIGLNEPGSSFDAYCQVTDLEEITVVTGQKYFNTNTPLTQGITVGLKHLLEAKTAMVMANGEAKSEIIGRMVNEEISESLPATILRKHKNGLLWIDEAASSKI
jgi:glucosamine-6-phosphate isomerase